jgi:SAM-dependent methyltransferase
MDVLEKEQLSREEALSHWYYRAKYELLRNWLRETVVDLDKASLVDIGCGEGLFLEMIANDRIIPSVNLCGIDPAYAEAQFFCGGRIRVAPRLSAESAFDLVLMMDVLEHVDDDRSVLQEAVDCCVPSGHLFITVPAFMWMWSAHDRYLGHKRRYSLSSLRCLLESVEHLKIERLCYFYAPILPVAALVRLWRKSANEASASDMRAVPKLVDRLLFEVGRLESKVARVNRLGGLTVVASCSKE